MFGRGIVLQDIVGYFKIRITNQVSLKKLTGLLDAHFFAYLGCGSVDQSTKDTSTLPSTGDSRHFLALDGKWLALKACLVGRVYLTQVWVLSIKQPGPSPPSCNANKCCNQLHKCLLFLGTCDVESS